MWSSISVEVGVRWILPTSFRGVMIKERVRGGCLEVDFVISLDGYYFAEQPQQHSTRSTRLWVVKGVYIGCQHLPLFNADKVHLA